MKRIPLIFLLLWLLILPCVGRDGTIWQSMDADRLLEAAQQYAPDLSLTDTPELNNSLARLADRAVNDLPGAVKGVVGSSLCLLVIVLLCAMAQSVYRGGPAGGIDVCAVAGAFAITAVAARDVHGMMGLGRATLDSMHSFSRVMLPVLAACSAATGHAGAAAARHMATAVFCNILITVIDKLLVGLVYSFLAACTAYAAIGNPGLKRIAEFLKWAATKILTLIIVAFITYLTVSGTVASAGDSAALKATKSIIATFVPVIGRMISDASETIVVGAGLVKNTAGLIGLIVVLAVCLVPFLELAVHYLGYRISAALSATVAESRLWDLISGIGSAFGLVLGMTGACALIMLVSILSTMAGGG